MVTEASSYDPLYDLNYTFYDDANFTPDNLLQLWNETENYDRGAEDGPDLLAYYYGDHHQIFNLFKLLIFIFGILTNILNIVVFNRKDMRNSTNYLLTALSVSDIFVTVAHLSDPVQYYYYSSINDYVSASSRLAVYLTGFRYMSVIMSSWISVAIGIWRFIAVTWPLKSIRLCSKRRAKIVISVITILAIVCCIPFFFFYSTTETTFEGKPIHFMNLRPNFGSENETFHRSFRIFIFLVFSVPVCSLICVTIGLIFNMYWAWRCRKKLGVTQSESDHQQTRTTMTLTVMLIIFIANNFPIMLVYIGDNFLETKMGTFLNKNAAIFRFFFLLDNTTTFFTYIVMSSKFRKALCNTFVCRCQCKF